MSNDGVRDTTVRTCSLNASRSIFDVGMGKTSVM